MIDTLFFCEVYAEAEEIVEHRAHNTAYHNQVATFRYMKLTVYCRIEEKTDERCCGVARETYGVQSYEVTWTEMYSVKC
jgi:hypothetical protein